MADESRIPTREEIATLPLLAQVAFAARCARRVLPLYRHDWPDAKAVHLVAVESAVQEAEVMAASRAACAAEFIADAAGIAARDAADAHAVRATGAAYAARNAADAAGAASDRDVVTSRAARAVAYAADVAAGVVAFAARREFYLLQRLAAAEGWTDATPVPPAVFGPLWPDGPPPGWPEAEPTSEGVELEIIIDVPEGASEADVLAMVTGLARRADAVHRAYGGHGLEVKEGNVDIDREAAAPVLSPTGGPARTPNRKTTAPTSRRSSA